MPRKTIFTTKTVTKKIKSTKIDEKTNKANKLNTSSAKEKSNKKIGGSKIKGLLLSTAEQMAKRKQVIKRKIKSIPIIKSTIKRKPVEKVIEKEEKEVKKQIRKEETPEIIYDKYKELPYGYNDTKIVLLVRDPHWIYAYWEINQDKINDVKGRIGREWDNSRTILRVYDVTDIIFNGRNAHKFFDISLSGFVNNWYINVGEPDRSYCVDIGILTRDNKFYLLARSNVVSTPRDTISNVLDEEWYISDEEMSRLYTSGVRFGTSEELGKWIKRGLKSEGSSPIRTK